MALMSGFYFRKKGFTTMKRTVPCIGQLYKTPLNNARFV